LHNAKHVKGQIEMGRWSSNVPGKTKAKPANVIPRGKPLGAKIDAKVTISQMTGPPMSGTSPV